MCVAAIAWQAHPRWRLVVAGNRDEFHERPTAPLARWNDGSGIVAGRDLRAGGTWLGVSPEGRCALVTNFRVEGFPKPDRLSRGGLITGWLTGEPLGDVAAMNPFNLFLADAVQARVLTNWPEPEEQTLPAGVHGLSNGAFNAPWPKTRALCTALEDWLDSDEDDAEPLFAALDRRGHLPGPDPEERMSAVFIDDPVYGTRCSTVVMLERDGSGTMIERRFDADGRPTGQTRIDLP